MKKSLVKELYKHFHPDLIVNKCMVAASENEQFLKSITPLVLEENHTLHFPQTLKFNYYDKYRKTILTKKIYISKAENNQLLHIMSSILSVKSLRPRFENYRVQVKCYEEKKNRFNFRKNGFWSEYNNSLEKLSHVSDNGLLHIRTKLSKKFVQNNRLLFSKDLVLSFKEEEYIYHLIQSLPLDIYLYLDDKRFKDLCILFTNETRTGNTGTFIFAAKDDDIYSLTKKIEEHLSKLNRVMVEHEYSP
eukprot:maker-scaffold_5-snap-gene-12.54-mRNA-1 protein AED:0.00 eAED:0.00 QI:62/1/1/1/0/0/2/305/246